MTDSEDIDPEELAEDLTDEALVEFSRLFGRDLTEEISDTGLQNAYEEAERLVKELDTLLEPDVEESEISQFMLKEYNRFSARVLGIEDVDTESLKGLEGVFEAIGTVLERVRFQIEKLGHPEYYETVEELVELIIEQDDSDQLLAEIIGSLEGIGEGKLQRIFIRLDQDLQFILENPEIETEETATEYLRMYERCCEQFKTLSPFVIYSANVTTGKKADIEDRLDDNLGTLVTMCSTRQRIKIFARQIDNDIRNAVAHDDFLIDPIDKGVEFSIDGDTEAWSYTQIRKRVVEARCAALSLFVFPFLLQHRENVRALDQLLQEQEVVKTAT